MYRKKTPVVEKPSRLPAKSVSKKRKADEITNPDDAAGTAARGRKKTKVDKDSEGVEEKKTGATVCDCERIGVHPRKEFFLPVKYREWFHFVIIVSDVHFILVVSSTKLLAIALYFQHVISLQKSFVFRLISKFDIKNCSYSKNL
jgi:hypothetical protein